MARPPKPEAERLTEHLTVRLTQDEKDLIDAVAGPRNGSSWAREHLVPAARRAAKKQSRPRPKNTP
ncbi:hypothetical protein [Tsukamurella hominis]|uniref:hypothetical protein n=1 Tax=Tsukamurella hominis TaxID=1970232 RepID=UPI0039EA02EB